MFYLEIFQTAPDFLLSASVEVLTGYILKDMFGFDVTNQDLALIGQFAENKFTA